MGSAMAFIRTSEKKKPAITKQIPYGGKTVSIGQRSLYGYRLSADPSVAVQTPPASGYCLATENDLLGDPLSPVGGVLSAPTGKVHLQLKNKEGRGSAEDSFPEPGPREGNLSFL
ncbi:hypothetical protein Bbelb_055950 [Branchiostoma belcheri]|nr:hypothetical protein Bbelb_055950 [Branchiostoma belcheri]